MIYELHVKGFSMLNPLVPPALRGGYAALAHPASVAHLRSLGITAVSLLPVHQHLDEPALVNRGLVNYWGYNTLGFFCADWRYASAASRAMPDPGRALRDEFRDMVKALHAAGIEVILDVVFNHTCESDEHGPTLSWRGLDNASWYRLESPPPLRYANDTGCGNMLDLRHPRVLQFVMDSLRFWVAEMHVDGFRFDLAPVLARGDHGFDSKGPFFQVIAQDPVLAHARLVAEPWDVGHGGYQLGAFLEAGLSGTTGSAIPLGGGGSRARRRVVSGRNVCADRPIPCSIAIVSRPIRSTTWCRMMGLRCTIW